MSISMSDFEWGVRVCSDPASRYSGTPPGAQSYGEGGASEWINWQNFLKGFYRSMCAHIGGDCPTNIISATNRTFEPPERSGRHQATLVFWSAKAFVAGRGDKITHGQWSFSELNLLVLASDSHNRRFFGTVANRLREHFRSELARHHSRRAAGATAAQQDAQRDMMASLGRQPPQRVFLDSQRDRNFGGALSALQSQVSSLQNQVPL